MKTPFIIYCRAVSLYAILTLPVLFLPVMYLISLVYVLIFGWFAWAVFTLLYVVINKMGFDFALKTATLFVSIVISVAFAYQMVEVLGIDGNLWHTSYVIFPFAAVIAGWISVCLSREKIRNSCMREQRV